MTTREPGFYWVKWYADEPWKTAELEKDGGWISWNAAMPLEPEIIGQRIEPPVGRAPVTSAHDIISTFFHACPGNGASPDKNATALIDSLRYAGYVIMPPVGDAILIPEVDPRGARSLGPAVERVKASQRRLYRGSRRDIVDGKKVDQHYVWDRDEEMAGVFVAGPFPTEQAAEDAMAEIQARAAVEALR